MSYSIFYMKFIYDSKIEYHMFILTANYTVDTKNKYFTAGLNHWIQLQMTNTLNFIAFYILNQTLISLLAPLLTA